MSPVDETADADESPSGASRAWVREQIEQLRHEFHGEVQARRVTIIDEAGRPVIVLASEAGVASVEVRAVGADGGVSVEMTAHTGPADRAAALSLTRRGNVIAALTVTDSDEGSICRLVFDGTSEAGRQLIIDVEGTRLA